MGGIEGMVPQLKPMLVSFAVTMSEKVAGADISKKIPIDKVRGIVENFLEEGLSQLTPQAVKLVGLLSVCLSVWLAGCLSGCLSLSLSLSLSMSLSLCLLLSLRYCSSAR